MPTLEELAPRTIREKRLDLVLDSNITNPRAFSHIQVNVSFARTMPDGVCMPLIFEVQGPSSVSYQRHVLRFKPSALLFVPREGGRHLVILREASHNRWWGSLEIQVAGAPLVPPTPI